jgi:hypothetical protein
LEATSALLSGNNICIAHDNLRPQTQPSRFIVVMRAVRSWNKGTQIWLALYVGKRLPAKMGAQVGGRMSHVTRHTSHVTRHTSHVTRHTSHVTRHTSHVHSHITAVQESHCDGHQCPVARLISRCATAPGVAVMWRAAHLTLRRILLHVPPGCLLERGGEEAFCSRCPFCEGVLFAPLKFQFKAIFG